ncbi:Cupin domain protein [Micromonospora citrea]|uniref:Cupin domain protein n=1 Tax=Micromonospora citrea TaxID=47855 RepID=A0A1C6TUB8_9ACTN|nr:cupin domain-containing protein [Micromonospora citrea]SCL45384.1 Cupin domain protein [Micromonospora citrea]
MEALSLTRLAEEQLAAAREADSGRSARNLHSGRDRRLRQTLLALCGGRSLDEHDSPGEATLQVLQGQVRLVAGDESGEGHAGDLMVIPPRRHALHAVTDAAVLLTVTPLP